MIQNLRFVFSHQDIVILTGIFFVILFVIFPIKKYYTPIAYRIIAACCLWWILIVFIYPPKGYNYKIYSYNASLTLNGQKAFDREKVNLNVKDEISYYHDAKYLDYTGAQHLLYVLMESLNLSRINPNLSGLGYQLWTVINFSIILLLIFYLNNSFQDETEAPKIWPIIFITFCPLIPFYIFMSSWEDKLIFLLIPLLSLVLIQRKKYKVTSFFLGFIAAFNGLTIFFLPIYLIFLFNEIKKDFWINIGIILTGIVIAMIPSFPESLSGWTNRIIRVNTSEPFWYSFYSFLPKGFYTPLLNKLLMMLVSLATIILFALKKINLVDSLIISISIVILFSPFNVIPRVIPIILFITILTPNINKYNWLTLALFLYVFLLFDNGYITPIVNTENTILFYIPILYAFALYLYKRIRFGNNIIWEISLGSKA